MSSNNRHLNPQKKSDAGNEHRELISSVESTLETQRLSRRSFFKGSVGLAAAAFTADKLISPAHAQWRFREYLPYDAAGDYHYGRYGRD